MNCLICEEITLQRSSIDENLEGYVCPKCQGMWIQAKAYWKWIKSHNHILPEKAEPETVKLEIIETPGVKICIDCGHFLTRRKIGHGLSFHIDRCQCCGGIWLDKNEWEVLKSRNLHDEIHFIFSHTWQEELEHEEKKQVYQQHLRKILGDKIFSKVDDFKEFLDKDSNKNMILAYLKNNE